ncbi:MAG: TonB-dependent receptor [Saprospiraceae bacterium]|nr:TonB-dependent receptor [Saprospiraceae bacterium]
MKMRTNLFHLAAIICCLLSSNLFAQDRGQTLKGVVLDKIIREPLVGATVIAKGSTVVFQAVTDSAGRFHFEGVPVERQTVQVRYIGYKEWTSAGIAMNSGKETDLVIEMEESALQVTEIVVTGQSERFKPLNPFAVGSARSFSMEETQRYAVATSDPARMASAFAGVSVPGDDNNTIVIRGNAPNGLLWRLEGTDLLNPNHFSNAGATGGAISLLSAQVLASSDFFTGAFPAEYGNALSGVFDLKLRKGNGEHREYTFQAGILGLEAAAEGPIKSGKQGSFLFNYRFSSLYLLSKIGIEIGDIKTKFQDVSFHIWFPAGRIGEFSLFGTGGTSAEKLPGEADSTLWVRQPNKRFNSIFQSDMGALGLIHQKRWSNMVWKQVLAWSGSNNVDKFERFENDYQLQPISRQIHRLDRITLTTNLTHKPNAKHLIRSGATLTLHMFNLDQSSWNPLINRSEEQINSKGNLYTLNIFSQWQYRPNDRLTFNAGMHGFFFFLNKKQSFEPRASVQYAYSNSQSLSLSYGLHSQMQPIGIYFVRDTVGNYFNSQLDLTRASHLVLSHRIGWGESWQLKTEMYLQDIMQAPVGSDSNSSFSLLNEEDGYTSLPLVNLGKGKNYGIEFSIEKRLTKGAYLLASVSLYQSKYKASDNIWRNTRYNGNYLSNLVFGKEWEWIRKNRHRSFAVNFKITHFGGLREIPVDLLKSEEAGFTIRDQQRSYETQLPAYFRIDAGLRLKRHFKQLTTTFFLDIQNVTNRMNARASYYHPFFRSVEYQYQEGLIPILGYKVEF